MATRSALINVMFKAADKASRRLMRDFGEVESLQVSRKGASDFVSQADMAAERTIAEELLKARPDWSLLMEESGQSLAADPDAPMFIVDPLDGTTNFLHGIPQFAISLAVMEKNKITAGLIYDPCRNETFFAEQGTGAFLNDRRIRVSGRRNLNEALFATGMPYNGRYDAKTEKLFEQQLPRVYSQSAGVRRFGSAALDLAWVAAGRFDGFWEHKLNKWDIAAGLILVREAGGFVSDFAARDKVLESGDVVAANSALHVPLLKLLKGN